MALTCTNDTQSNWTKTTRWLACAATVLAAGCAVGPNYKRPEPTTTAPIAFKEAEGWKAAAPGDTAPKGPWWTVFEDPILNDLEAQVAVSNQTLAQAVANYESSRQLARADRTGFLPTISATGSGQRAKNPAGKASSLVTSTTVTPASTGANGTSSPGSTTTTTASVISTSSASNTFTASLQASWEPDIWGKVQRTVEADVATAQADAAELAAVRLSTQSTLAQQYILLRALDEKARLLSNAVKDYNRTLTISKNKYAVGVAARSDVISAQSEQDATRAQLIDTGVQRSQIEHAIAVLIGKLPAAFSLDAQASFTLKLPMIPAQMPSALLERRPDVAQAEREIAAANAKVGVQTAAYFPSISLTGSAGYEGSPISKLFTTPFEFWSLGGSATDALLDWGERHDQVLAAKAAYHGSVANYRQVVLTAFQQVEDNLSGLRILAQESEVEDAAVSEASEAARITLNEYNAGTVDYTTVITAQVNELTNREAALTIHQNRLVDSVGLIAALGGGWDATDLPASGDIFASKSQDATMVAAPKPPQG